MVIARIGVPQIALLTMPASAKGKEDDHPLFPHVGGSTDPSEHVLDRFDRTAEAEISGNGLDSTQEEEQLVGQLQTYFQQHIRCGHMIKICGRSNKPLHALSCLRLSRLVAPVCLFFHKPGLMRIMRSFLCLFHCAAQPVEDLVNR